MTNSLPFTADVVRLRPLAEVAGEFINGKKTSKHNVSRQLEETGRNVVEPFRATFTAAPTTTKCPEQNQQSGSCSHDADKLETEARVMRAVRICVSTTGNSAVCKRIPKS